MKTVPYNTRDGSGNDIVREIEIKQYPRIDADFACPICGRQSSSGCRIKDIVSSNFTDWQYVGDYVCPDCADLFSLYFYNYIVDPDGIHLYNVREIRDQLTRPQKPPFMACISTSHKKHLFYKAAWNQDSQRFAVNLETETIHTSIDRMRELFDFVECMQTLGAPKTAMAEGHVPFAILQKIGFQAIVYLQDEIKRSREIQIPLFCGQKREITEDEALCIITSILTS